MNIAIAIDGDSMDCLVSEQLEKCNNLLIINAETMDMRTIANPQASEEVAGQHLADTILKHDCEAVITGLIRPTAFEPLAGAGVTRFLGAGLQADKALELMHRNSLRVIREANGIDECGGSHHHH